MFFKKNPDIQFVKTQSKDVLIHHTTFAYGTTINNIVENKNSNNYTCM